MAITYQSAGAVGVNSTGVHTFNTAFPASIAAGDLLVCIVGQKPATANGGGCNTPSGFSALGSALAQGGYGATLGADTGNTNLFVFHKRATGSESGNLSITCTDNDAAWAVILRLSSTEQGWDLVMATGGDTSAGNVSVAFGSSLGMAANDYVLGAVCIPTDVTTPSQFSAHALSQTGITFGTVTEVAEPDNAAGNDIGGYVIRAPVSSGTAGGNPTMTATAGGTTTNVRGPAVIIRIREIKSGAAALSADGTLTAAGLATYQGSAALSADGNLAAAAVRIRTGAADLSGAGDQQAAGVGDYRGAGSLAGAGDLQAAGNVVLPPQAGSAALAADGTLTAAGVRVKAGAADLSGGADLQAAGVRVRAGGANLSGDATLAGSGVRIRTGGADLTGAGDLQAAGDLPPTSIAGSASLSAGGSLAASGTVARPDPVPMRTATVPTRSRDLAGGVSHAAIVPRMTGTLRLARGNSVRR